MVTDGGVGSNAKCKMLGGVREDVQTWSANVTPTCQQIGRFPTYSTLMKAANVTAGCQQDVKPLPSGHPATQHIVDKYGKTQQKGLVN